MDLRKLKYFLSVYERKNLSHAARECNVAQSAISNHMKSLEQELGVSLFRRLPRGMEPTAAGTRLYDHARTIFRSVNSAIEDIHQMSDLGIGSMDLGLPFSIIQILGVEFLSEVKKQFPNVKLVIHEGLSSDLQKQILEGELDSAYCYNASPNENIISRDILSEELMCVGLPDIVGKHLEPIEFDDTMSLPRIMLRRGPAARSISTHGKILNRLYENPELELNSVNGMRNAILAGVGVAVCPYVTTIDLIEKGQVVARPIRNPQLNRMLNVIRKSSLIPTALMEHILALAEDIMARKVRSGEWPTIK